MKINISLVVLVFLGIIGCTTGIDPGISHFDLKKGTYYNDTHNFKLKFDNMAGFEFVTTESNFADKQREGFELGSEVRFMAVNPGRFLWVILVVEDGESVVSNEDYQSIVKLMEKKDTTRTGFEELSLEKMEIGGNEAVVWRYSAKYDEDDFVSTYAFFQFGTKNYVVIVYTLEIMYERKRKEIDEIINSFDFIEK